MRSPDFTIPPISYTYFDPADGEYRTIATDPIEVNVLGGSDDSALPNPFGSVAQETVERQGSDIRHIKAVPAVLSPATALIPNQSIYWLAWLIPLLFLAMALIGFKLQDYRNSRRGDNIAHKAARKARKAIKAAHKSQDDPYVAVGQIFTTYLSERLGQPVLGLTQSQLADLLAQQGLNMDLIERVQRSLVESDMGRFGPRGQEPNNARRLLDDTAHLIDNIEKALNV